MTLLAHSQRMTMLALERGPDYLDTGLFSGSAARIVAGMKVHANTISHGRLVALEETFPRTRRLLGEEHFNALSRQFLHDRAMPRCSLAQTGAGFPSFLETVAAGEAAADMARFEWLWLECYHAADAEPVMLADLAGIAPADLMAVQVLRHPAARIARLGRALHAALGREAPVLAQAHAILVTRPAGDVLVHAATPAMQTLLACAEAPIAIGNLFAALAEQSPTRGSIADDGMTPIASLLQAGAFALHPGDAFKKDMV